eukprot:TRINITY_DN587_c0_g1_i2.p1 TRINITY_DN587_c0_g1~~TRINITY_DN587_c0_g1_i2.p1  ORF type:complete len:252 (+),score=55.13 TRINITY_DN587_c0_g1_i2:85-756(+)
MGEKREGICGKAQPLNPLWDAFFPYFFTKPEPDPMKFEGKWFFDTDGVPEGPDALLQLRKEKFIEKHADVIEQNPLENIQEKKMGTRHRLPRPDAIPHFSDYRRAEYCPGYDIMKFARFRLDQLNHCIGNLGEDHPTCKKAAWYYRTQNIIPYHTFNEEMEELGHFDTARKWGIKNRRSFIPLYQPVKQNIPGAFEFYRSKRYLDAYDPEGEGEIAFPFTFVE